MGSGTIELRLFAVSSSLGPPMGVSGITLSLHQWQGDDAGSDCVEWDGEDGNKSSGMRLCIPVEVMSGRRVGLMGPCVIWREVTIAVVLILRKLRR